MKIKGIIIFLGLAIATMGITACQQASAKSRNAQNWLHDILSQKESSLEKVNSGYEVKGNLKNRPNALMVLSEMTPDALVFIDSIHSDKNGNFILKGNMKEPLICQLQWSENSFLIMVLDNKTEANLQIVDDGGGNVSYSIEGKNIEASVEMKELIDLNTSFGAQFANLETQARNLGTTQADFEKGEQLRSQYMGLMENRSKSIEKFAMDKKKSLVPYFILSFRVIEGKSSPNYSGLMRHAIESARAFYASSKYPQQLQTIYDAEKTLMPGELSPEINMRQPNGDSLSLSSLRGKVVLIDFWASWCGPCRKENPFNKKLYSDFKPRGFEIYGVSLDDDPNRWKAAIKSDSLTWRHVSDLAGWGSSAARLYKVGSIPDTYLLDKEGRIIAKGLRGEALRKKLEEILVQ